MPIKVTCACGKVTNVPDAYAGRTGKCPGCGKPVRVPGEAPAAVKPAAAPVSTAPISSVRPAAVSAPSEPIHNQPAHASIPISPRRESVAAAPAAIVAEDAASEVEATTAEGAIGEDAASEEESDTGSPHDPQPSDDGEPDQPAEEPIPAPPSEKIHLLTKMPHELEQPNCPTLYLVISTEGANVFTQFDASPVLDKFIESLAKSLKGKFDVRLGSARPQEASPVLYVHLVRIYQGKRWLRYVLPILANFIGAATCVAIDGNLQLPGRKPVPFKFKHGCWIGVLRGPRGLLKADARVLAKKLAVKVRITR